MSPWWRERLVVRVNARELRVARWSRGPRRVCKASTLVPVAPTSAAEPWRAAIDALALLLQDKRWRTGHVAVEVSSPLSRWLLLPASTELATDEEWKAYAQMEFAAVHGERARDWELRLGEQTPRAAVPASAIDRALLLAVQAACSQSGQKLDSVEPTFSALFDGHRTALRTPVAALAHLEAGRLMLAVLAQDRWHALADTRISSGTVAALEAELIQADALGGLPPGPRRLHVIDESGEERLPPKIGDWDVVTRLERPAGQVQPVGSAAFAMRSGG